MLAHHSVLGTGVSCLDFWGGGEAAVAYAMLTFSYYPVEFCYGSADDEQLETSSAFEGRVYVQYRGQACSAHLQASCGYAFV